MKAKLGIVGAGRVASHHAAAVLANPEADLVAVADIDIEVAGAFAREWGCDRFGSRLSDIAENLDGVIICSPSWLHFEHAVEAINAGIGALVEKPFTSNPEEAREIITIAQKSGAILVAAQVMRHLPMFEWARERINAGDLGQPIQVIERRLTDRSDNYPWWANLPAFLVSHWGSHSLDLVCDLLGDRGTEVLCQADSIRSEIGVIDDFGLQVRLASGARAVSVMSFSSRLEVHDLVIIGSDSTLSFRCYESASINGELALELPQEEMISLGFQNQIEDFVGALKGAPSRGDPQSVLPGLELVRAAEKSALGAGLVEI